jgi:YidC/Oxa1 family membrane protein insertase
MSDLKNLFITLFLSTLILVSWQYFYERPKLERMAQHAKTMQLNKEQSKSAQVKTIEQETALLPRETTISQGSRVQIQSPQLQGSIALKGARFDDIILSGYKTSIKKDSTNVTLLSPSNSEGAYFAEFGWISAGDTLKVPDSNTLWKADKDALQAGGAVNLTWDNGEGLLFKLNIALDDEYMFKVTQSVTNSSGKPVNILPYGLINRLWKSDHTPFAILHEGPLGAFNNVLSEHNYRSIKEDGKKTFPGNNDGWLGITDKYWLAALIPDKTVHYDANFSYMLKNNIDQFQVDYLGQKQTVASGESAAITNHFFAGAKRVELLDKYSESLNLPLFDRAIDFGWFYFLTKPMFHLLQFFFSQLGNFGLAILMITVIVKLVMFPLANKSYKAMNRMKLLQPEMLRLRELYKDDKMTLNKEVMELYKREKVNPVAGCLPMLLQIPVFFSLYKVLFVTIEMRHAPFFGWIHDLSAPDPTSIFTLFGLIPITLPGFLTIGIWPMIMCATMIMQQKMNPEPTDPVQAKVTKLLPFFFVFMFHSFPAGLIIYWAWNNTLSVLQQLLITRTDRTAVAKVT